MALLQIGEWSAAVDDQLFNLAAGCSSVERFRTQLSATGPRISLRWVERSTRQGWIELDGETGQPGCYRVEGDELLACIPPEAPAAEAAMRALFQIATLRQGGVLIHASAARFGSRSIVALGPSGAGKSTLARFCVEAGGELLSDETVALYPDGRVLGTPFFSDDDLVGSPGVAQAARIFWLEKGDTECLQELPRAKAVAMLLAQAYRPAPGEAYPHVLLDRAAQVAKTASLHRFVFRKHPDCGHFVKRCLLA
jgi:hypothetical protein